MESHIKCMVFFTHADEYGILYWYYKRKIAIEDMPDCQSAEADWHIYSTGI